MSDARIPNLVVVGTGFRGPEAAFYLRKRLDAARRDGAAIPARFVSGQPFHAVPTWAVMEAGVNVMAAVLSE